MSAYKTSQEFITYRDRRFHFVSYEGQRADVARHKDELPPTWYLMRASKRWPVMQQVPGQEREVLLRQLTDWLEENIFGPEAAEPVKRPA